MSDGFQMAVSLALVFALAQLVYANPHISGWGKFFMGCMQALVILAGLFSVGLL